MGLDMYLEAHRSVAGYEFCSEAERKEYQALQGMAKTNGLPITEAMRGSPHAKVVMNVGYWRKANAIHQWFVDNVQNGKDECQISYVDVGQLKELMLLCKGLLKNQDPDEAREILPPSSGFFFGGTDIDEWYWQTIADTVAIIEPLLKPLEDENGKRAWWSFYYQASW